MATIFFAWELGAGLGHVSPLQPVIDELARRGHRVFVALRHVSRATMVFQEPGVRVVQAPYLVQRAPRSFKQQFTFAHILHNIGFHDVADLRARTDAWAALYELINPDVIVFDHSPTALLASARREVKRLTIGTGFCCPPHCEWFPNWRPSVKRDPRQLRQDESRVRDVVNELLATWRRPPLNSLSELYARVDDTVLTTFPELDHYQPPREADYWGTLPAAG